MLGFLYGRGLTVRDGGLVGDLVAKAQCGCDPPASSASRLQVPQAEATLFEKIDPTA
jgi:hypothetical protein